MLRSSLKLVSRQSVGSRTAVAMPRNISVIRSPRWECHFTAEAFTKHTPTAIASSKGFSSKFRLYATGAPKDEGTLPTDFDDVQRVVEEIFHSPNVWRLPIPDDDNRLKVVFNLIDKLVLYLRLPVLSEEATFKHLYALEFAHAPPTSEIGRGRTCFSICIGVIVHILSSIPVESPLRTAHPNIFDTVGALEPLCDHFLADRVGEGKGWEVTAEELGEWSEFFRGALRSLIELGRQLFKAGFTEMDELDDVEG